MWIVGPYRLPIDCQGFYVLQIHANLKKFFLKSMDLVQENLCTKSQTIPGISWNPRSGPSNPTIVLSCIGTDCARPVASVWLTWYRSQIRSPRPGLALIHPALGGIYCAIQSFLPPQLPPPFTLFMMQFCFPPLTFSPTPSIFPPAAGRSHI